MLSEIVQDKENLYRAAHPTWWIEEEQRYSSVVFKSSKGTGVSVDRDGGRQKSKIIQKINERFPNFGILTIYVFECKEQKTYVTAEPVKDNEFHAEIHDSPQKKEITSQSKARKLLKKSKILRLPS